MKIWVKDETSISGKSLNQRICLKTIDAEKPLIVKAGQDGRMIKNNGGTHQRWALEGWCKEHLGDENPPFATVFEFLRAAQPRKINPKAPAWLK